MEWAWAGPVSARMREAVLQSNWAEIAELSIKTAERLSSVQVSANARVGKPWEGAFERLKAGWTA